MLTISRLSRWSINYYNDTANQARQAVMDRQAANGGLSEYYSEGDTRVPTWVVVGDKAAVAQRTGLGGAALDGGCADTEVAARWLDGGIATNAACTLQHGHYSQSPQSAQQSAAAGLAAKWHLNLEL